MFIFQSKFINPPNRDRITEKSGTSKKNQWDFQISKVRSLDFLNLKVNGSPAFAQLKALKKAWCFFFFGNIISMVGIKLYWASIGIDFIELPKRQKRYLTDKELIYSDVLIMSDM